MGGSMVLVMSVSFSAAFFGGVLSFFSPCIFPVLPGFIGYLMGDSKARSERIWKGLGFVIGLSIIFILLGSLTSAFGTFFMSVQNWVSWIGGSLIILLGLWYLGWIRLPQLRLLSKTPTHKIQGFWGALMLGIVISFAWVPCVSPVLGSILTIAAQSGSVARGTALLSVYALGFSIPLFLLSIFVTVLYRWIPKIMQHEKKLKWAGGIMLIVVGVLMVSGLLNNLQLGA